jgi:pimeloyl-ACP methyl ester carboxylesterase
MATVVRSHVLAPAGAPLEHASSTIARALAVGDIERSRRGDAAICQQGQTRLVMHSEDDQIVPIADSAPLAAKLRKNGALKVYKGLPHGVPTTHPEIINPNLPAFIQA